MQYFKEIVHEELVSEKLRVSGTICAVDCGGKRGRPASRLQAASPELFVDWRYQHSVSRKGSELSKQIPPLPDEATLRLPRFTYCLHIDQYCLDTVDAQAATKPRDMDYSLAPPMVAGLIDGDFVDLSPKAAPRSTWAGSTSGWIASRPFTTTTTIILSSQGSIVDHLWLRLECWVHAVGKWKSWLALYQVQVEYIDDIY